MPAITVTFFTKISSNLQTRKRLLVLFFLYKDLIELVLAETMQFSPHRVALNSRDLLASVNTILNALNLPMVDVSKAQQKAPQQQQQSDRYEVQFKTVDIDKFYDFAKIPKVSIKYEETILILCFNRICLELG